MRCGKIASLHPPPINFASYVLWYGSRYATTKITITLQDDQIRVVREFFAAGNTPSVSAFVQHAFGVALFDAAGWRTMLDDALRQTGGALTKEEQAWADTLLRPPKSHRPAKKGR